MAVARRRCRPVAWTQWGHLALSALGLQRPLILSALGVDARGAVLFSGASAGRHHDAALGGGSLCRWESA